MNSKLPYTAALLLTGGLLAHAGFAQPVRHQVLKELTIEEVGGCHRITTTLQFPLTIHGFFPATHGTLLTVEVLPLDRDKVPFGELMTREALVPAAQPRTALQQVTWEGDAPEGAQLTFKFNGDVVYTVTSGADFRSIVVTVRPTTNDPAPCTESSTVSGAAR